MTAPAGATAFAPGDPAVPLVPFVPFAPFAPGEPAGPAGPGTPAVFHVTRRSPAWHFDASRNVPFARPDFFAQALIFLLAALVANAPNADAVTAPTTASRHTVATALTNEIRGMVRTYPRPGGIGSKAGRGGRKPWGD